MTSPSLSIKCFLYGVLVLVFSFILQFIAFDTNINFYDDGIILVGAQRVLAGELPYKDFWTMYSPGQFYLIAYFFKYFGESVFWLKFLGIVSKSLIACVSFFYLAKYVKFHSSIVISVFLTLLLIAVRNDAFPVFPSLACSMIAIYLISENEKSSFLSFFFCGLFTGCSTIFRHDIGFYTFLTIMALLPIEFILNKNNFYGCYRELLKKYILLFLGIALVFIPVLFFFLQRVGLNELYFNLIYFPSEVYILTRSLPFPNIFEIDKFYYINYAVYFPFVIVLPAIFFIWLKANENIARFFSLLLVFSCLLSVKGLVRVEFIHMLQAIVISIILLFIMMFYFFKKRFLMISSFVFLITAFFVLPIFISSVFFFKTNIAQQFQLEKLSLLSCLDSIGLSNNCFSIDPKYKAALMYVAESTEENDYLYIGPSRHDKIYINPIALYFLADRKPFTKWHESHPGLQTTKSIQQKMIGEMASQPPKLIILDSQWDNVSEPNHSSVSSEIYDLDIYISENYFTVQEFGSLKVLKRNE